MNFLLLLPLSYAAALHKQALKAQNNKKLNSSLRQQTQVPFDPISIAAATAPAITNPFLAQFNCWFIHIQRDVNHKKYISKSK